MEELQQRWMIAFNFCLILGTNLLMRPTINLALKEPNRKIIRYYNYYGIAMILFFSLFSFWGLDWFHYLSFYENIIISGESEFSEEVYIFIITYLSPSYIVFRLWVWGLATVFLVLTFKKTKLNLTVALFFFTTTWLLWFSYARVSLAMAMLYFGAALTIDEDKTNERSHLICGLVLVLLSFAFHKSAIFGIVIVVIARLFYNRKIMFKTLPLYGAIVLVSIIAVIMNSLDIMALYIDNERATMMAKVGQAYVDGVESSEETTLGAKLMYITERLPYYMMGALSLFIVFGKRNQEYPNHIKFFAYILFLELLYASVFAIDYGFDTQVFYGRFLRFTAIPATVVLTYMYSERKVFWLVRYTYMIAFLGVLYNLFYILISAK